jgi:hypothetical protein
MLTWDSMCPVLNFGVHQITMLIQSCLAKWKCEYLRSWGNEVLEECDVGPLEEEMMEERGLVTIICD